MIHASKGNDDGIIRVFTLCQKILKILIQLQNILIIMSWLEQTIENESHRNLLNTSYSMPLFKYMGKNHHTYMSDYTNLDFWSLFLNYSRHEAYTRDIYYK